MSAPATQAPRPVAAGGHTAATLYEAVVSVAGPGRWALDPAIRPAWVGATVAAPAFTVQGAGGDNLALQHALEQAPAGSVLVVDTNAAPWGHWGEVLAVAAQARGLAGLVIDGGVRDTVELSELGFPVFSRHVSVRGTRKLFPGALGVDVVVGGVPVSTGDLVVGDADGVVVVPQSVVGAVVTAADERIAKEAVIMDRLRAGESPLDVYGLREVRHG